MPLQIFLKGVPNAAWFGFRTIVQVILVAILMPIASFAAQSKDQEVLVVGSEFAYLYEKDQAGKAVGFAVDILKLLAQRHQFNLRFEFYPWSRAQWMVEQGQAQILIGPYKTPQREQKFQFARKPFYRDQMLFFVRKGSELHWQGNLSQLNSGRIAVVQGWVYGEEFEKHRARLNPVVVANLSTAISLLQDQRFDYLAANRRNVQGLMRNWTGAKAFQALEPPIQLQDGYLAYCKSELCDQVRSKFDQGFQEMINRGEIGHLLKPYAVDFPN